MLSQVIHEIWSSYKEQDGYSDNIILWVIFKSFTSTSSAQKAGMETCLQIFCSPARHPRNVHKQKEEGFNGYRLGKDSFFFFAETQAEKAHKMAAP